MSVKALSYDVSGERYTVHAPNVDLQKLIKLLTVVMSTVRTDTVGLSGKHVIQSILLT